MNQTLRDAYYEYCRDVSRQGTLDHALTNDVLDGISVEQHMIRVLRSAGRLPHVCATPRLRGVIAVGDYIRVVANQRGQPDRISKARLDTRQRWLPTTRQRAS
jgi:hypothetical protein